MATIATNVLTRGFRGMFGNSMVFRTMYGKTFVSAPARKPDKKKESEAQRKTRVTFAEATQWAQLILLDPEKKTYYQERAKALKLPNAYTAAITDYMRKPKVEVGQHGADTLAYTVSKKGFVLQQVTTTTTDTTEEAPRIKKQKNEKWLVLYKPQDGKAPSLTLTITDSLGRTITNNWANPLIYNRDSYVGYKPRYERVGVR